MTGIYILLMSLTNTSI